MDYVYKYLFAPIFAGYYLFLLVMYLFALTKWVRAKGNVIGYTYKHRGSYLVIEFTTDGQKIEFEGRVYPFSSAESAYPKHSEIDILHSHNSPDVAMIHSIWSPIVYLSWIAFIIGVGFFV